MNLFNALLSQRQLQDLRSQLDQRGALVNQLEGQLVELRRNMVELSARHRETLELLDDVESDLEDARARQDQLEADARDVRALLDRESAALQSKDAELGAERRARELSESELRARIDQLLSVVSSAQDALAKRDAEHQLELKHRNEELLAEREARKHAEADLRARIEQLGEVVKSTQDALSARDVDLRYEKAARSAAEGEIALKIAQTLAFASTLANSATNGAQTGEAPTVEPGEPIPRTLGHIEELKAAFQRAHMETTVERRSRKEKETQIQVLHATAAQLDREKKELQRHIDDLTRQHGDLSDSLRSTLVQSQTLSEELSVREKSLARANEACANAVQHANDLAASLRLEENANTASKETIARLEAALQDAHAQKAALEEQLRGKIDRLIERREAIKGAIHDTHTELERVRAARELAKTELASERELRRMEFETAKARIEGSEQQRQETKRLLREAQEVLRGERETNAALRAALDREMNEKAQLSIELAHAPMRRKLAAMEEALHVHLGRALDLTEPVIDNRDSAPSSVEAIVRKALERAAGAGGVLVTRGRKPSQSGAMTPQKFAARYSVDPAAWAVPLEDTAAARAAIEAAAPGARTMALGEVLLRIAAAFPLDPSVALPTGAAEVSLKRLVVVTSETAELGERAAAAIANLAAARVLPRFPTTLLTHDKANAFDADAWLSAALAAVDNPKIAVLHMDGDAIEAFAHHAANGRATTLKSILFRARMMTLVWSDKALGVAHRQAYGADAGGGAFDEGDARMSVPAYRALLHADQRLERLIFGSGLFKQNDVVKAYIELTDTLSLVQFCRDAGFALKSARADEDKNLFAASPDARVVAFAQMIRAAVEKQAAHAPAETANDLKALARAEERAGRYADALRTYSEALRAAPTDFAARAATANYLELSGHMAAAERTLRDGLRFAESLAPAAEALRDFYRRTGNDAKVLAAARLLQRAGSNQGAASVAGASERLGKTALARRALDTLTESQRSTPALKRVARLVALRENLDELRTAAERGGAEHWFALGEALRQLDEVSDAVDAYSRAEASDQGFLARACGPGIGPDLLLIGPPRTATTLLRRVLELSPAVALPSGESSFLINDRPTSLSAYIDELRQARAKKDARLTGDKSPLHFTLDSAHVALAARLFPHARIIVTTRAPVARAWSEIKLFGYRRVVDANIAATLTSAETPPWLTDTIEHSRYLKHLQTWAQHFGVQRMLLLQSEDFEHNVHENCVRLFDWLDIERPADTDVERLQQNWTNRTANFPRSAALSALLESACGGEIYSVEALSAALAAQSHEHSRAP